MGNADNEGDTIRSAGRAGPDSLRGQGGDLPADNAGGPGQPSAGQAEIPGRAGQVQNMQETAMRAVQGIVNEGGANGDVGVRARDGAEQTADDSSVGAVRAATNDGNGNVAGEAVSVDKQVQPLRHAASAPLPHKTDDNSSVELKKIGKKYSAAVYLPASPEDEAAGKKSEIINFSDQEAAVLQAYARTGTFEDAAAEVKIKVESVKRILRRPNLKRYLLYLVKKTAIPAEINGPDFCKVELAPVWAGQKKVTDDQKWAMNNLVKLVTPKGSGVTVNVQQNSVYGGLTREQVNAKFADARAASAETV